MSKIPVLKWNNIMLKITSLVLRTTNYKLSTRLLSSSNFHYNKNEQPPQTLENFTPVYKFPYIRTMGLINRLKFYQTVFTATAIPTSLMLWEFKLINPEVCFAATSIGITGCVGLFTLGILANKFVGFVYINNKEDTVKVAYVDFWGRRQDEEVPLKDIIPFSEVPASFMDGMYLKFNRFSVKSTLKINVNYGQILDKEKFKKVFAPE